MKGSIAENYIQHGSMKKPDKFGVILIIGWMDGEDLMLLISNDGIGMSPEQTLTILSGDGFEIFPFQPKMAISITEMAILGNNSHA